MATEGKTVRKGGFKTKVDNDVRNVNTRLGSERDGAEELCDDDAPD